MKRLLLRTGSVLLFLLVLLTVTILFQKVDPIQYDPKTQTPFVEVEVGDQKFERRDIELGVSDGLQVEVKSGLSKEDKIKVWNQLKPVAQFGGR